MRTQGGSFMEHVRSTFYMVLITGVLFLSFSCSSGSSNNNNTNGGNNTAPVADAGQDQDVTTGSMVTLNGSGSTDSDGDTLTYIWQFSSVPAGSTAVLSDATLVNPTFTADVEGSYSVNLIVSDGLLTSSADTVVVTATSSPAQPITRLIPDTGQTLCYDITGIVGFESSGIIDCSGTGQDGEYSANPMSLTNNGNGTVTDNVTGLVWEQADTGGSRHWEDASNYCSTLLLGGLSDWRLPTVKELISLANYGTHNPAIDEAYFPNTSWGTINYWSSTSRTTADAEVVSFHEGTIESSHKTNYNMVRCVSGQSVTSQSFTDNSDGTITDNVTGLMWQREDDDISRTWVEAIMYCQTLSLAGYNDWRLPNIKELESLADYTTSSPAVNSTYFPGLSASRYWSSTTAPAASSDDTRAWTVNFDLGYIEDRSKLTGGWAVQCVR